MWFVAGALGLTGLAGNLFNASLALSAVTGITGAAAKNQQARQTASYAYQAAEATARSADAAMIRQQEATNSKLADDRKATAQAKLENAANKVASDLNNLNNQNATLDQDMLNQIAQIQKDTKQFETVQKETRLLKKEIGEKKSSSSFWYCIRRSLTFRL